MVFQNFNLFPHMTALENVMLAPRRVLKKSQAECRELAQRMLEKVGLGDRLDYYPANLSGGQQQRVAIARRWPCRRKFYSVTKSPRRSTRNWWVKC
nr:Glutamine transport ATP-binding protein GlnQ [Klebsiella pneumoniae]